MSQRPPASRPASRSPPDGQRITLPAVQLRDDPPQGVRAGERQSQEQESRGYPQQANQSPQHARPHAPPSGEDWRSSGPSRDLGVHSILNPSESETGRPRGRRQSVTAAESPQHGVGRASQFGASPRGMAAHPFQDQQPPSGTPPIGEVYPATFPRGRRILTPRSPARAISSGRGLGPTASPFLPSRGGRPYTAEPGPSPTSDVPALPTPPGQAQQQYGFPPMASAPTTSAPTIAPRRASGSSMQAPGRAQASQSASPSISASSQNPSSSQTSPASFLYHKGGQTPQSTTSYYPGSSFGTPIVQQQQQGGVLQFQGPSGQPEGPYSAPAPQTESIAGGLGQAAASDPVHVLTYSTSVGTYHIPVDTHQASRLADEKRARNAGASARFRQRRKEKEKEANSSIEKLQQQNRDLEREKRELQQERDFYRAERDRFREAVYRTPEGRHLVMQAPPSPQTMRTGSYQGSMTQMGAMGAMGGPPPNPAPQMGYQPPESSSERPSRRRRTDTQGDFTSLSYTLPPTTTLPPVQAPGYLPAPGPGPGQTNLPPLRIENTSLPPATTSSSLPPSTTAAPSGPYDPFSRNPPPGPGPYERSWPPGDSGRR